MRVNRLVGKVNLRACNKTPIGTRRVRAFGPITKHWPTREELSAKFGAVQVPDSDNPPGMRLVHRRIGRYAAKCSPILSDKTISESARGHDLVVVTLMLIPCTASVDVYPFTNNARSHERAVIFTPMRVGAPTAAASGIPVVRPKPLQGPERLMSEVAATQIRDRVRNACYGPPAVSGGSSQHLTTYVARLQTQTWGQSGADDRGLS